MSALTKADILYEDAYLIAINKPAGLMVEPDKFGNPNAVQQTESLLERKPKMKAGLGVVHRLDRPVSGVLLFAKTPMALKSINEQIRNRSVKKEYTALVTGVLTGSGKWTQSLRKSADNKRSEICEETGKGCQSAETRWKATISSASETLLSIQLKTGRFHQIRAHCSANGHPIVGDEAYGGKAWNSGGIALHSSRYSIFHPKTGERLTIESQATFYLNG
ncbi:MAG: RluA family pseudouridine synthase [Flavobacteriia bacterium]|nr:RluA family pseudouridine synthase [Flavobacteriia bacterium]